MMATAKNDPNQLVKIKLHKDKNNSADVFVAVNNHKYQIKRGVVVEVPQYIADVINNSIEQDEHTAMLIEQLGERADF